jgi:hypothetical protein
MAVEQRDSAVGDDSNKGEARVNAVHAAFI